MIHEFEKINSLRKGWLRAARTQPYKTICCFILLAAGIITASFLVEKGRQLAVSEQNLIELLDSSIVSVIANVEVIIKSNKKVNTKHLNRGGYLAFGRGSTSLLVASASQSFEKQIGDGRVTFSGKFEMGSSDDAVDKPIRTLRKSEYAQISFLNIPVESEVLGGKVVVVINGSFRFEFGIPYQQMKSEKIMVLDVGKFVE